MVDKAAPRNLFPSQREAFRNAIDEEEQLVSAAHENCPSEPQVRNRLVKSFPDRFEPYGMGRAREEPRQISVQYSVGDSAGPPRARATCIARVAGPQNTAIKLNLRLRRHQFHHRARQGLGNARVHLHGRRAPGAQARPHQAVRGASRLRVPLLHERHAHRRGVLPRYDSRGELRAGNFGRRLRGGHRCAPRSEGVFRRCRRPWHCFASMVCRSAFHAATPLRMRALLRLKNTSIGLSTRAHCSPGFSRSCLLATAPRPILSPTPLSASICTTSCARCARRSPCSRSTSKTTAEFVGGCIAGGRRYLHINAAGDVEPCVFAHYSNANIHDASLLDALRSPILWSTTTSSPSTATTCARAPFWKIRACLPIWSRVLARNRPICSTRKAPRALLENQGVQRGMGACGQAFVERPA